MLFRDRVDAGSRLAGRLAHYRDAADTIVLGIPRGGIIVAAAAAERLHLPIGICAVRKLGAPGNPELAIGAVDEDGGMVVDWALTRRLGVTDEELEAEVVHQQTEMKNWLERVGQRTSPAITGMQVILIDDGIATGSTAQAAIQAVRRRGARGIILAVPVAPRESLEQLRTQVDECVCVATPHPFYAVGNFYESWPQVTDAEVLAALQPGHPE